MSVTEAEIIQRKRMSSRAKRPRSAVTSGRKLFVEGDPNSAWSRRYHDLVVRHIGDLGGRDVLSEAQLSLIRRAAAIECELERLDAMLSTGAEVNLDAYGRAASHLRRLFETLGIERKAKPIETLSEYLARMGDTNRGTATMTTATHDGELVERSKRWFDTIPASKNPWKRWLDALPARHLRGHMAFTAEIEYDVERLIDAADRLRLSITPETKRFGDMWTAFRRYHEARERDHLSRRLRYLVWRAAALTMIVRRGRFQDEIDANQARDLLAATMADISPDITADGWCKEGGNFWQVWLVPDKDGIEKPDPLSEYAVMVMTIMKRAFQ